jgi:hypothetical protein
MRKEVMSFVMIIFLILGIASITYAASNVVINEVMPSNSTIAADQNGEYDDWIELYNNSAISVDIAGYYLTDNSGKLTKWKFPSNTLIAGNGYLIVWADKDTLQSGLHTNFKLSADGEKLYLLTPEIGISDQVKYGVADSTKELSYARVPNGTGAFSWHSPTFGKSNNTVSSISEIRTGRMIIYPNPAQTSLTITDRGSDEVQKLIVYNLTGSGIYNAMMNRSASIDVSTWNSGVYFIAVNGLTVGKILVSH